MPHSYLSKTDFKTAFDCRTKLYYRKHNYPSNLDEDEYIQFLADGGFMVEVVAKARYPHSVDLAGEHDHERACQQTKAEVAARMDAVVLEASVIFGRLLARIDILRREGGTLHLIEVKSSSIDQDPDDDADDATSPFLAVRGKNRGQPTAKWKPYLLDIAFQTHVLRQVFPKFSVKPWLCVVNKAHVATVNETLDKFLVVRDDAHPKARPEILYSGDLKALERSGLMVARDVTDETNVLMPAVIERAGELAALIDSEGYVTRVQEPLAESYKTCRKCEYRYNLARAPNPHGFAECWGTLANATPHVLDLHRVTQIGSTKVLDPIPALLQRHGASLLDLDETELGSEGAWQARRHLQWSFSHTGRECLPSALRAELVGHQVNPGWPLQFLDFEACNVALPHHAGLHPYERVAFQWSCHTLYNDGRLGHSEWLNTRQEFPNFAFAESLRQRLGDQGTVYVWSSYEQSTLKQVLVQIDEWLRRDPGEALRVSGLDTRRQVDALVEWIDLLLGPEDEKGRRHHSPRIRDLHALAYNHYFHPEMLGRTSIKVVLPAIWRHDAQLRAHPWFAAYSATGADGTPLDPYETLPPLPLGDSDKEEEEVVVEGTGAVRVYQDLVFRRESDPQICANREQLLKQYCKLDTAAMLMIWMHWTGRYDSPPADNEG